MVLDVAMSVPRFLLTFWQYVTEWQYALHQDATRARSNFGSSP